MGLGDKRDDSATANVRILAPAILTLSLTAHYFGTWAHKNCVKLQLLEYGRSSIFINTTITPCVYYANISNFNTNVHFQLHCQTFAATWNPILRTFLTKENLATFFLYEKKKNLIYGDIIIISKASLKHCLHLISNKS